MKIEPQILASGAAMHFWLQWLAALMVVLAVLTLAVVVREFWPWGKRK